MAAAFTEDVHTDHGSVPVCPGCGTHNDITKTHVTAHAHEVTFSCGHRGMVNPERGTTVSTREQDGKLIKKVDNRMYILLQNADENKVVDLQHTLETKDKEIAELAAKVAKLEGLNK